MYYCQLDHGMSAHPVLRLGETRRDTDTVAQQVYYTLWH